jgi:hypothetical protein
MRKFIVFVGGMFALAAIFVIIASPAIALALWCAHRTGLSVAQFGWLIAAFACLRAGVLLFVRVFGFLKAKGNVQALRVKSESHVASSPVHHRLVN